MVSGEEFKNAKIFAPGTVVVGSSSIQYVLTKQIAAGGEAVIYKAEAPDGHLVALKMHYRLSDMAEYKRFNRTVAKLQKVKGGNVLLLEDYGFFEDEKDRYPFLVHPFISGGRTLEHIIFEYRMQMPRNKVNEGTCVPYGEILHIGAGIANGLKTLHDARIQHRDLKPTNILTSGSGTGIKVWLGDFGLARSFDPVDDDKVTVGFAGTPEYVSPEQFRGEDPAVSGDIWALGVIFYEMITGVSPFNFEDNHRMTVLSSVVQGCIDPTPIETYCTGVNESFVRLTMRCMERDTAKRPQSMDDILEALNWMQVRLPEVSESEAPAPIICFSQTFGVNPDAMTMAAPSTPAPSAPPKPSSVSEVVIPPNPAPQIDDVKSLMRRARSADAEALKEQPAKSRMSPLAVAVLAITMLVAGGAYYLYHSLYIVPVSGREAVSANASASASAEVVQQPKPREKAEKPFSLADIKPVEPPPSAKSAEPASSEPENTKHHKRSRGYSSPAPIPGIDYIPGGP